MFVTEPVSFVTFLTEASRSKVDGIIEEIEDNKQFNDNIKSKMVHFRTIVKDDAFLIGAIGEDQSKVLYAIIRALKPNSELETGPGSGISSSYILLGLDQNHKGKLVSLDLSSKSSKTYDGYYVPQDGVTLLPEGEKWGWLIPIELKARWKLIEGKTSDTLYPAIENLKSVDMFFHDSEHSYENMKGEFHTVWPHLKKGQVLLFHDVLWNDAFLEFSKSVNGKTLFFLGKAGHFGGIVKLSDDEIKRTK